MPRIQLEGLNSIYDEPKISTTIKENPYTANTELEGKGVGRKGEVVLRPDGEALHDVVGKRHYAGGVETWLPEGSFVFSDFKDLALNKRDHQLFELKEGGSYKKWDNTPAEVLRRNVDVKHYNKMSETLTNKYKDNISKNTAELMLNKYQEKLGQIAFLQESKKGFPDGQPAFSQGTAPVYQSEFKEDIMEQKQYLKGGGRVLPKYQKAGTVYTDNQGNKTTTLPDGTKYTDYSNGRRVVKYPNGRTWIGDSNNWEGTRQAVGSKPTTTPVSETQSTSAMAAQQSVEGVESPTQNPITNSFNPFKFNYDPNYKPKTRAEMEQSILSPKFDFNQVQVGNVPIYSEPKEWGVDFKFIPGTKGINLSGFDENGKPRAKPGTPNSYELQWRNRFFPRKPINPIGTTSSKSTPNPSASGSNPPSVTEGKLSPVEIPWQFTPWQKYSMGLGFKNYAMANRLMPMRSQINSPLVELERMVEPSYLGEMASAFRGNSVMNPYLAGANNNQVYGQMLNAKRASSAGNISANNELLNRQNLMNNQFQRQDLQTNIGADQQYYNATQLSKQNFDNLRSAIREQNRGELMGNVEKNESLAQMLARMGRDRSFDYDFRTGQFWHTGKGDIMSTQSGAGDILQQYLSKINFEKLSPELQLKYIAELQKNKGLGLLAQASRPTAKMGGYNPYRR